MAETTALTKTFDVDGETVRLSPAIVTRYILGGNQNVPEKEIVKFIALCSARKLNPFTGDVYMTSYNTKEGVKTSIVVGKEAFTKRAQRNPKFRGMEAGVTIIDRNGNIERRPGSMVGAQTEKLIGGWAKVYVDGWLQPAYDEVALSEYDTQKSLWKSKPATMIRKVAIVHALREAFPDEFQGMYDAAEMGVEEPRQSEPALEVEADDQQPDYNHREPAPEQAAYIEDDGEDYLFGGNF